jgi:hypothetical protein
MSHHHLEGPPTPQVPSLCSGPKHCESRLLQWMSQDGAGWRSQQEYPLRPDSAASSGPIGGFSGSTRRKSGVTRVALTLPAKQVTLGSGLPWSQSCEAGGGCSLTCWGLETRYQRLSNFSQIPLNRIAPLGDVSGNRRVWETEGNMVLFVENPLLATHSHCLFLLQLQTSIGNW